jgi:hypothetical protein
LRLAHARVLALRLLGCAVFAGPEIQSRGIDTTLNVQPFLQWLFGGSVSPGWFFVFNHSLTV